MRKIYLFLLLVLVFLITDCQSKENFGISRIIIKDKTITVEIAANYRTRVKGLMNRKSLEPDTGMLFIYPREQYLRFWMKDTLIPLSIAFIKPDGTISQIKPMQPQNEEPIWASEPVQYALEMNQGWFERNNIGAGDKIYFPDEIKQIKAEGD